jgi:hypothetical protein
MKRIQNKLNALGRKMNEEYKAANNGEEDIPMYLLNFGGELDKVTVSSESNSNYNHTR